VHKIVTYGMDGAKPRTIDLHELTLPDGSLAHKYPRDTLFAVLSELGVSGIDNSLGQLDLMRALVAHQEMEKAGKQ
jgi:hypothetical protein